MKIIIKERYNKLIVEDSQSVDGNVRLSIEDNNKIDLHVDLDKDEIKELFFAIGSCYELATGEKLKKQ